MAYDLTSCGLRMTIEKGKPTPPLTIDDIATSVRSEEGFKINMLDGTETNFTFHSKLAEGSFGKVFLLNEKINSLELIAKFIKITFPKNINTEEMLKAHELRLVTNISKEFIVQYYLSVKTEMLGSFVPLPFLFSYNKENHEVCIVMERIGKTLWQELQSNKDPNFLKENLFQICLRFAFLETEKVGIRFGHRDLKSNNIMINYVDGKPKFKIIDFGYSCIEDLIDSQLPFRICFSPARDISTLLLDLLRTTFLSRLSNEESAIRRVFLALLLELPVSFNASYLFYNRPSNNNNLVYRKFANIVSNLQFKNIKLETGACDVEPTWTSNIITLYPAMVEYLTDDELRNIRETVLQKYMKSDIGSNSKERIKSLFPQMAGRRNRKTRKYRSSKNKN
jgi:serine/threonine protein kinase